MIFFGVYVKKLWAANFDKFLNIVIGRFVFVFGVLMALRYRARKQMEQRNEEITEASQKRPRGERLATANATTVATATTTPLPTIVCPPPSITI